MDENAELLADPQWLPHRWMRDEGAVSFLKLDMDAFAQPMFLADRTANTALATRKVEATAVAQAPVTSGALHFIFHTAFCRSTLLVRALNIFGRSVGMNEPAILADCAGGHAIDHAFLTGVTRLLARPHGDARTIFVKPTNLANRLIPTLMEIVPNAKAICISHDLRSFLNAINRRGLFGRDWVRKLYMQVQGYAPLDMCLDSRATFALTDMQVAGLVWMLQRRWFTQNMAHFGAERMGSLDSDRFNKNRLGALAAVTDFVGAPMETDDLAKAIPADLFDQHSKLGGDYATRDRMERDKASSAIFDEEAVMVGEWIANIMQQAGLENTLANPIM
ncbi:MAG: hypothetical protein WA908_05440 [Pontixanthobacter sp.]